MRRARAGGFTLLEVLVALALLAITFAAALGTAARSASGAAYLRDRTLAAWVATNELARAQLAKEWPPVGVTRGSSWMGQREWPWQLRVVATEDDNVRRLEVSVGEADDGASTTLVGYVLKPQAAPKPGTPAGEAAPGGPPVRSRRTPATASPGSSS